MFRTAWVCGFPFRFGLLSGFGMALGRFSFALTFYGLLTFLPCKQLGRRKRLLFLGAISFLLACFPVAPPESDGFVHVSDISADCAFLGFSSVGQRWRLPSAMISSGARPCSCSTSRKDCMTLFMAAVLSQIFYEVLYFFRAPDCRARTELQGFGITASGAAFPPCAFADWENSRIW